MCIRVSEYVIAYLDMLGTKSKIERKGGNNAFLNVLYGLYHTVKRLVENICDELDIKIISDGMIIAKKLECQTTRVYDIKTLLYWTTYVQSFLATHEYSCLVRGGITIGELYMGEDIVVWGPAFTDAFNLENDESRNPRIVIDPKRVSEILGNKETKEYISKDSDGKYFLDYMGNIPVVGKSLNAGFEEMKKPRQGMAVLDTDSVKKLCWQEKYANKSLDDAGWETDKERLSLIDVAEAKEPKVKYDNG